MAAALSGASARRTNALSRLADLSASPEFRAVLSDPNLVVIDEDPIGTIFNELHRAFDSESANIILHCPEGESEFKIMNVCWGDSSGMVDEQIEIINVGAESPIGMLFEALAKGHRWRVSITDPKFDAVIGSDSFGDPVPV